MIVGGVIFLVAFLGCCGAWKESKCLIYTYAFFLAVILVAQVLLVHILSKTGQIFFVLSNTEQTFFWEVLHLWIHNCRCWISCQVCNLFCKVYSSQGSWCGNIPRKWRTHIKLFRRSLLSYSMTSSSTCSSFLLSGCLRFTIQSNCSRFVRYLHLLNHLPSWKFENHGWPEFLLFTIIDRCRNRCLHAEGWSGRRGNDVIVQLSLRSSA